MRRAGRDLKSRRDYTGTIHEICTCRCVRAESLTEELMNTYSCPLQGLLQPLPVFSPAWWLSVIQATKPCSPHSTCGSQLLSAACEIGTWQVQTSMLRWQGLGILWEIVSSLCKTVFLFAHTQHCFLAFCQFVFWLYSLCFTDFGLVYIVCIWV